MFKDLLIQWITELNDKLLSVGQSGYLSIGIGAFNATLYGYIKTIMTSVVMPVAYVILALFFVLELYKASIKIDGAGGGSSFGAEMVFKVMFRMVLLILSRLVDTFSSRILYPMLLLSENHSIAVV